MAGLIEHPTGTLYEADEHAWIERQIAALRDGDVDALDRVNLIAYLSDMTARDRRELGSRLILLYAQILKLRIQPEMATRSWRLTIRDQQRAIRLLFRTLPGLKHRADEILKDVYPDAVEAAFDEIGPLTGSDSAHWSEPDLHVTGLLSFDAGDAHGRGGRAPAL
nr:DUF29 domain-containing protein [uncultured Rhodopila sp.]